MSDYIIITVTTASEEEAARIGHTVVEKKLAACVNISAPVTSFYTWQGKIETAREYVLHIKTRAALFDRIEARVKSLHSYECPCIIATSIVAGNEDYLNWIAEQTVE